ncbi:Adenosylmethionine-8-amino-7-oxononanoate aminotransferase [hydrothermal vent metagenome]|uniref:Adenosylmethionine-8-amino-7-oxononanoate aminotransferase n=1 Tax=hydrothermal vent metagenome TaxID=652676 RepID=A0A3B0X1L3_9ZZZZ
MNFYQQLVLSDRQNIWHPYSAIAGDQSRDLPVFPVISAEGVRLKLADNRELIDGMSSWWSAIHGYNHPQLNQAIKDQLENMSHVMFGGLTHPPAVCLAETLIKITPDTLTSVFFSDSGSVSVEVAMKMAIQYWHDKQRPEKQKFLTVRSGYHGDTFAAMSVSDPVTGMHSLFNSALTQQVFIDAPCSALNEACNKTDLKNLALALEKNHSQLAAFIIEPVVQGTGGMRFYSADFLNQARALCDQFNVLLIFDEIATGFGRTGKLFACEYTDIQPDIMCIGKALTGGYLSLAATLVNKEIAQIISNGTPGVFMHGPTFMANPLACAVANASIELLLSSDWQARVKSIESWLGDSLQKCAALDAVADVRVFGAIGVVECKAAPDMTTIQQAFVDQGVWIRPFGKLIYLMPPFIINKADTETLCDAVYSTLGTTDINI